MSPPYKFPRSSGSLDLTDPESLPSSSHNEQQSHPSLLITDSHGHASQPSDQFSDQHYLDRFTSAAESFGSSSSSSPPSAPSGAHLSAAFSLAPSAPKTLSRISERSEYSVSAYSSNTRDSSNPDPPSTPPRTLSPSPSPIDPAFPHNGLQASFSFPTPPAHAQLPPPPASFSSGNYHLAALPSLPGSPIKHHLPTRPLTTPLPARNPTAIPVPVDNFAAPPSPHRSNSPYGGEEVMVQLPGRSPLGAEQQYQQQYQHAQKDSDSSSAWATAEDEKVHGGVFFPGDGYTDVSLVQTSSNRFTLDAVDGQVREKQPGEGWAEEEDGKRGNKWICWGFLLLMLVGVGVGVGVGVSQKKASEAKSAAAAENAASSSSSSSSASIQTVLRPSVTSVSFSSAHPSSSSSSSSRATAVATAAGTFTTTFAYSRSGATTVVPLTYTIPSSYDVRANGQWQFTEAVVLPAIGTGSASGSFTSDLRFRVQPTSTAVSSASTTSKASSATATTTKVAKRDLQEERLADKRRWQRKDAEVEKREAAVKRHAQGAALRQRMLR